MRLLLAFIALACVDARWGAGGGKGAAHRKREARDQVLLEEIRAQHEDITENEMLEILAERRVEADAHHHHKRRAKLHAHMNSQDYLHSGGLVRGMPRAASPRFASIGLARAGESHRHGVRRHLGAHDSVHSLRHVGQPEEAQYAEQAEARQVRLTAGICACPICPCVKPGPTPRSSATASVARVTRAMRASRGATARAPRAGSVLRTGRCTRALFVNAPGGWDGPKAAKGNGHSSH